MKAQFLCSLACGLWVVSHTCHEYVSLWTGIIGLIPWHHPVQILPDLTWHYLINKWTDHDFMWPDNVITSSVQSKLPYYDLSFPWIKSDMGQHVKVIILCIKDQRKYSTKKYLVVCAPYDWIAISWNQVGNLRGPAAKSCRESLCGDLLQKSLLRAQLQQFFAQKYFGSWSGTPFIIVFPTENFGSLLTGFDLLLWQKKTVPKIRQLTARIWSHTICFQHRCVQQPIMMWMITINRYVTNHDFTEPHNIQNQLER